MLLKLLLSFEMPRDNSLIKDSKFKCRLAEDNTIITTIYLKKCS